MAGKKILLMILILFVCLGLGIGILVFIQSQKKELLMDEKIQTLHQDKKEQSVDIGNKTGDAQDFYENLSNVFAGEGYEQVEGEFGFTAEGF